VAAETPTYISYKGIVLYEYRYVTLAGQAGHQPGSGSSLLSASGFKTDTEIQNVLSGLKKDISRTKEQQARTRASPSVHHSKRKSRSRSATG
jgi:hypothetical protein